MTTPTTANSHLTQAKRAKNDEFYTQYHDIEKEIEAYIDYDANAFRDKTVLLPCDDPEWSNFTKFFVNKFKDYGIKKIISTSYAANSKFQKNYQPTPFEKNKPQFDANKSPQNGKIYTLTKDKAGDDKIDIEKLEWHYLEGDGDFRSDEVKLLRDEADIIITNPPFSLFREFLAWIVEADKQFVIIGNMNAITYKDVFSLIKENKLWLGNGFHAGNAYFATPADRDYADGVYDTETGLVKFRNCNWFTNFDHGRRHQPLPLMTTDDNLRFNKKMQDKTAYETYDNYDAIEVSFTNAIPSDYDGLMGVPISFLDKYNPDQFEIVGMCENLDLYDLKTKVYTTAECKNAYIDKFEKKGTYDLNASGVVIRNGLLEKVYQRVLIQHKKPIKL
jgi:hypothetical protein